METPSSIIETLVERAERYGKTSYELTKLKSLETTTIIVSSLLSRLGVLVMLSLFALFLNIGIALMLGDILGKSYYGFLIVSGFYLITGIVFYFFLNKWIKKPISDLIITEVLQ
jgi:hypothetical protein